MADEIKQQIKTTDDLFSRAVYQPSPIEELLIWLNEETDIRKASKVRSVKRLLVHVFGRLAAASYQFNYLNLNCINTKKMKFNFLIILICLLPFLSFAQFIPFNPSVYNITYSDEFNGARNSEWSTLEGVGIWGNETFSTNSKYLTYSVSGSRHFLNLKAYVEDDNGTLTNYSAGLFIPAKVWNGSATVQNPDNPFYYGYYEIEARLTKGSQSMSNIGLWPAFWFQHSESNDPSPGKYWSEEVDIFEPGACHVRDSRNVVHLWTLENDNAPPSESNTWRGPGFEGETFVDMFTWHTYGLEWLPNRLVFYVDGVPFHTVQERIPFHDRPQLFIDLQLSPDSHGCANPRTLAGTFIGTFQVNYFRYYKIPSCGSPITETSGNVFNFNSWSNNLSNTREYCIFKNTSTPSNSSIIVRASDYVELKENFTVPYGATFEIRPTPCQ